MNPTRYPLQWPVGWKRTPANLRRSGNFRKDRGAITVFAAIVRILQELWRLDGTRDHDVVVSTNLRTRLDGLPRSDQPKPEDPGAAVYWQPAIGSMRCMAIDVYAEVEQNLAALAATIEAMRAIERHGGAAILDRAFQGFAALPAPIVAGMKKPWREVLGVGDAPVDAQSVQATWRMLALQHHPDRGGSAEKMAEINTARDEALQELSTRVKGVA